MGLINAVLTCSAKEDRPNNLHMNIKRGVEAAAAAARDACKTELFCLHTSVYIRPHSLRKPTVFIMQE